MIQGDRSARGEVDDLVRSGVVFEEIVEEAREREREIRLGAEDYADDILSTLEVNLQKFLQAVQRGRDRLQGRDREPSEIG